MSYKKVKLIEGSHLTVTERRHILQLINLNYKIGGTKRKKYTETLRCGNRIWLTIESKGTNDYGRASNHIQKVLVEVK